MRCGWLVVDKPLGITSADVLRTISRRMPRRGEGNKKSKLGHAGTLDPMATGVLPVACGAATKAIPYLSRGLKCYEFHLRFGLETTTGDQEGGIVDKSSSRPSARDIEGVLGQFLGTISQIPPVFSAIKIGGRRACDLARAGHNVVLAPRLAFIDSLDYTGWVVPHHEAAFRVVCGSGTYVRSLARSVSRALGTLGYVSWLRRVSVGLFGLEHSKPLEKLVCMSDLLPLQAAFYPSQLAEVSRDDAFRLRRGQLIQRQEGVSDGAILTVYQNKPVAFISVGRDHVRPLRVLGFWE